MFNSLKTLCILIVANFRKNIIVLQQFSFREMTVFKVVDYQKVIFAVFILKKTVKGILTYHNFMSDQPVFR